MSDREAAIREALLDTSNALVPGTMTEAAHDALGHLDSLLAELAAARVAFGHAKEEAQRAQAERDEAREREAKLREAIAWVCGEEGSDFYSEWERGQRGLPIYWWRAELMRRAALADGEGET